MSAGTSTIRSHPKRCWPTSDWHRNKKNNANNGGYLMKLQEIRFSQANQLLTAESPVLTREAFEKLTRGEVAPRNKDSTSFYRGELCYYSKKLKTLGCNIASFTIKGRVVVGAFYHDATNTRNTRYYAIIA